jgi:hypothetical protein
MKRFSQLSAASILALSGCASVQDTSARTAVASDPLTSLDGGLDALVGQFNANADKPRVVALLSPT